MASANQKDKGMGSSQELSAEEKEGLELLEKIRELEQQEKELDKQLEEFEKAGIREDDTIAIMKAVQDYNETRDAAHTIIGYLSSITGTPVADLLQKYKIPPNN